MGRRWEGRSRVSEGRERDTLRGKVDSGCRAGGMKEPVHPLEN